MIEIGEMILRIAVGGLLGALIGLERHLRAKEAGIRTHFLVGLGSALFMVISQFAFPDAERFDAARIAAQVVSGMGFLGAGLIIFQKNSVRGLTTAAGIWVVSAIGLASGAGMFWLGAAAAVMAVICLEAMHFFLRHYEQHQIRVSFSADSEEALQNVLQRYGHELQFYTMERHPEGIDATIVLQVTSREYTGKIFEAGRSIPGITITRIQPVED
ncbi:MAG: MgtC/SapB family protein [Bacteroidales bacterium]|nr:MgtC/SapB family protein [Bacteroidales bacterium]